MSTSMILLEEIGGRLNEEHQDQLARQSAAAKRLGILIDDLLQLSRLGRKEMKFIDVDLTTLAREIGEEIIMRGASSSQLDVVDDLRVHADVGLVRILLENLIGNAVKYSPDGGTVRIGKDQNGFYVRDEGVGFDMKYAHKLFLPFERLVTERDYPGTGIGLAIVDRIVKRHGGRIWAESEPGKGSTFHFTL
jgi:signal transduction histidine kinase